MVWARHANPWSVYTRMPILPLGALVLYGRIWIGWWCLLPFAAICAWTYLNPRAFSQPKHFNSYASRGVLGERVWLDRAHTPIPKHHSTAALLLSLASGPGVLILIYGLWVLNPWAVMCGLVLTMGAKLWYFDRMVWLYDDVGGERFIPPDAKVAPPPPRDRRE
ncbi:MAG: DUF6653 family protein [Pseudomonadota bacterium]